MSFLNSIFKSKKKSSKNSNSSLVSFLAKVSIFENLSKHERKQLDDFVHVRKFSTDEVVFKKNYPNIVMYIVMEGHLKAFIDENQNECVKEIEKYGYFGEFGVFVDETRSTTVVAAENSTLLAISKRDMKNFIDEHSKTGSKILFNLAKILSKHLIKSNDTLIAKRNDISDLEEKLDKQSNKIETLTEELENLGK